MITIRKQRRMVSPHVMVIIISGATDHDTDVVSNTTAIDTLTYHCDFHNSLRTSFIFEIFISFATLQEKFVADGLEAIDAVQVLEHNTFPFGLGVELAFAFSRS
jgi:hypothetical protein